MQGRSIKQCLLLITFTLALAFFLLNIATLWAYAQRLFTVFTPLLLGAAMAFVLNILVRLLERKPLARMRRGKRALSIVLSLILITIVFILLINIVVPQVGRSLMMVAEQLPDYMLQAGNWVYAQAMALGIDEIFSQTDLVNWENIISTATSVLQSAGTALVNSTVSIMGSIVTSIVNFVLGLVFAIYILAQKEILARQFTRLFHAFLPKRIAETTLYQMRSAATIFHNFVTGQLTEAVIIGALCFGGMLIFQFPHSAMISVLVGTTALIPVVGAFIGTAIGAFLILMISPVQALWFVIYVIVLQQFEGNIIYPKVVGGSIGLPGIWVLAAVTVGGGLGGIMGILFAVPLSAFIYGLLQNYVNHRLGQPNEDMES